MHNPVVLPAGLRSETIKYRQHDYSNTVIETRSFVMVREKTLQEIADEESKALKAKDKAIKEKVAQIKRPDPMTANAGKGQGKKIKGEVEAELPSDKIKGKGAPGRTAKIDLKLPSDTTKAKGKTKKSTVREMLESAACTVESIAARLGVTKQAASSLINDLKHDGVAVQSQKGQGTTQYFIEMEPDETYSDRVHDTARALCEENPMFGYDNAVLKAMEMEPRRVCE